MRRLRASFPCILSLLALSIASPALADDAESVNLLRLSTAAPSREGTPNFGGAELNLLFDDDLATVARFDVRGETSDVVFEFGGRIVTVQGVAVRLPSEFPPGASARNIELLVSSLSATAGFVSLRSDPLQTGGELQEFEFPPTAARWIMLRLTPAQGDVAVVLAEASVNGYERPPATHYAFKESPAKAFDVLAKLKRSSAIEPAIEPDEADVFADALDGTFDKWSPAEAALVVSGATESKARKEYLRRLDRLEAQARRAIEGGKTPFAKGEKLLTWLHRKEGPLSGGYESSQTDLTALLDKKTFNCVSSAVLYQILARRLGLDVRAIEVPDHAFAILYDGTRHADVETTTESGFNPSRDREAQAEFEQQTGFRYIPDSHRDQRREIGEAGLAAIICYNHGVTLTQDKRHHEALMAYFRAMSLDREFDSAVKNALAALANWSGELSAEHKFEEAVNVLATGLELAPRDATLLHNQNVVWTDWALFEASEGRDEAALDILRRAAAAVPEGEFAARQAWVYLNRGEKLADAGQWQEAIEAAEKGLDKVDPQPREELVRWRSDIWIRWADAHLKSGQFAAALDVLGRANQENPLDKRYRQNLVYTVQERARAALANEGEDAANQVIVDQRQRFPDVPELAQVAQGHVQRVIEGYLESRQFDKALEALKRHRELLDDENEAARIIFDAWSSSLADDKQWEKAADVYQQALEATPADDHLRQNLVYTIQEWAKSLAAESGEERAREMLLAQRRRFADIEDIQDVAKAHAQRVVSAHVEAGEFDLALASAKAHADLFADAEEARQLTYLVYDRFANVHVEKKEWRMAVDLYAEALKDMPDDDHLKNNAVATWNFWAETFMDAKDWQGAIEVYEQALEQFADDGTLKNNLEYCQAQK